MIGHTGVGKTCLANTYKTEESSTVGAAFTVKNVHVGNQVVQLHIWDTAGLERYKAIFPIYYRNAHVAVVVYDVNDYRTLDAAFIYVKELKLHAPNDIIIVLAGNKLDLANDAREVETEDGRCSAQKSHLIFTEVSAKTGAGVSEMFNHIANAILSKRRNEARNQVYKDVDVRLTINGD